MQLNARQILAASMLAWGVESVVIAKRLKIDPRTLYRWRQIPEFQGLVTEFCSQAVDLQRKAWAGVLDSLLEQSSSVFTAFKNEFIDPPISQDLPPELKLKAYGMYWRFATHAIEALDFHERLTKLENSDRGMHQEAA